MITGTGVDIIEIERIKNMMEKNLDQRLNRIFTEGEIALFKERGYKWETIAANFAGKEAVAKALGTGIQGFTFKDIEVLRNQMGKPRVTLYGKALALLGADEHLEISLSHCKAYAIAYVIRSRKMQVGNAQD